MTAQEQGRTLNIKPKVVLSILIGLEISLLILSLVGQYLRIFPNPINLRFPLLVHNFVVEFDVNSEANITTYYSVSLAIASAFLLFVIAYFKYAVKDKYRFHWAALSLWLLYISLDDASVIHEKVSKYLKGLTAGGGWFEYKWVFVGLVVIGILAISFFRFWLALDNKYKFLFLLSAGVFFGGAVGTEMIGGRWAYSFGSDNFTYKIFTTLEQGLQYAGLTLLVYSLLLYIQSYYPRFSVSANAADAQEHEPTMTLRPEWAYIFLGVGLVMLALSAFGEYIKIFPNAFNIRIPFQTTLVEDYTNEFDFTARPNIAIYYNILILDAASLLLFVIAYLKAAAGDKHKSGWIAFAWIVFLFAIDTLALLHPKVSGHLRELSNTSGWFNYNAEITGIAAFIVILVFLSRFWLHLDNKFKALFLTFILMTFAGEFGIETIKSYAPRGMPHLVAVTFGQALQYGGSILLVYSLLLYIKSYLPQFYISTKTADAP
jgi:hypothetical protein